MASDHNTSYPFSSKSIPNPSPSTMYPTMTGRVFTRTVFNNLLFMFFFLYITLYKCVFRMFINHLKTGCDNCQLSQPVKIWLYFNSIYPDMLSFFEKSFLRSKAYSSNFFASNKYHLSENHMKFCLIFRSIKERYYLCS